MKKIWMKLAFVLMTVGAVAILLSTVLSIQEMDYHFTMYVEEVGNRHHQEMAQTAVQAYEKSRSWDEPVFAQLDAVSSVLGLQLALFDSRQRLLHTWGGWTEQESRSADLIPLVSRGEAVGYLTVGARDQSAYPSMEDHFQLAHTTAMQWTMLALLLLVIVISVPLARTLVRPVVQVSEAAQKVAKGKLHVRVPAPRGQDEIAALVEAFNDLVHSLQHQEQLRQRLTSDIAHELRTPLNTLLAQVEGMIDGIWRATDEHLEAVRREVLRLSRLVSDLDQVIQAEAGTLLMNRAEVDVGELAHQVADAMSAAFARGQIQLREHLAPGVRMLGDHQRLAQVVANLLQNACKHTPENGEVVVRVWQKGERAHLQVKDNGAGIPSADIPFVFERFYRGDRSRTRESGGAGLGLTIVKGIVEAHDGEIALVSEVGKGTAVTVSFPRIQPEDAPVS